MVLNGINVSAALGGSNANEDFTVTNHGLSVTPDYIQNVSELWWAASILRAGGQTVPEMVFLLFMNILSDCRQMFRPCA